MKFKLEEKYSHSKLWSMCNIYEFDSFYFSFLLILVVLILFSVTNHVVCYFRLLKFTLKKYRLNTVYTSDSIQQENIDMVEYTFNH